jgi:hypothetical protein
MMTKAEWLPVEGQYSLNLGKVWKTDFKHHPLSMDNLKNYNKKNCQVNDMILIHRVAKKVFGAGKFIYESEKHVYIEDYLGLKKSKTLKNKFGLQSAFFDHVLYYMDVPILLESDEDSHREKTFYINLGYSELQAEKKLKDAQDRDTIKNVWCEHKKYLLIRLPDYTSNEEKEKLLTQVFTNIKWICINEKKISSNSN